ncbi:MAG: hypothetical protein ACLTSZ_02385 [Lachnospiraceae bacterium]
MDILRIIDDIGPGVQDPIEWERDAPIHTRSWSVHRRVPQRIPIRIYYE